MEYTPELASIAELAEASYNPRKQVEERMTLLRLSLLKLGFLLPVYATLDGHLLSGHQRMDTCRHLGAKHMPLVRIPIDEAEYRQLNLVFNRATNDMRSDQTSKTLFSELLTDSGIGAQIEALPDLDPNSPEFTRCMESTQEAVGDLVQRASVPYVAGSVAQAKTLAVRGIVMPVVAVRGGKIVNGNFRAYAANEMVLDGRWPADTTWPVVWIEPEWEAVATAMLNMVSMEFTVEEQHADLLRFGSFRRPANKSFGMSRALRFFADGKKYRRAERPAHEMDQFWGRWRQEHGRSVCDFGAGQRRNSIILEDRGVSCLNFEPYSVPWETTGEEGVDASQPSLPLSRKITDNFLEKIAAGAHFDSVFLSAVLNSVPFYKDRLKVLACAHGLCSFRTRVYGTTRGIKAKKMVVLNSTDTHRATFELGYETNTVLGEINKHPKVQKYMDMAELRELLERFWCKVEIWDGQYLAFRCSAPRRVDPQVLREAVLFEFDLPYENGRLDRAQQALDAYGKRHGIDLRA